MMKVFDRIFENKICSTWIIMLKTVRNIQLFSNVQVRKTQNEIHQAKCEQFDISSKSKVLFAWNFLLGTLKLEFKKI